MLIVGAGLAGLISANIFPQATVIEAAGRDKLEHKALLRFRSTAVADATGIEFRKVRVNKGLWHNGKSAQPSIRLANLYSLKVVGRLADRSIWNLEPSDRYVAPEDFISQLMDNCGSRINFNTPYDGDGNLQEATISTMPMPILANLIGEPDAPEFKSLPIHVTRFRVIKADVFQTIYFTDPNTQIYRASITGNMLIVEAMGEVPMDGFAMAFDAFGLHKNSIDLIDDTKQSFGKIAPIDDAWRERFILRATVDRNIYSVGRFACWRNILLDDVVKDLSVVKRLIKLGHYHQTKESAS